MIPRIASALSALALVLAGSSLASAQAGSALGAPVDQIPPAEAPTGYPAQRWNELPAPGTYDEADVMPRLDPDGPRIIGLREEAQRWRLEAASIDMDVPLGFWIGGLATVAVGGVTALGGLSQLDVGAMGAGLAIGLTGVATWLVSFIIWRVQARRRHNREMRAQEIDQQIGMLTGRMPPTGFRF